MVEKGAGKAVAFGADVVTTGGFSSWGAIANLFKTEVVFTGVDFLLDKKRKEKTVTIEDCISKGVFDSKQNVFEDFRKRSNAINPWENGYVQSFNNQLTNKMAIPTEKPFWVAESGKPLWELASPVVEEKKQKAEYAQVPMVVAPGHEQEYLDNLTKRAGSFQKKSTGIGSGKIGVAF